MRSVSALDGWLGGFAAVVPIRDSSSSPSATLALERVERDLAGDVVEVEVVPYLRRRDARQSARKNNAKMISRGSTWFLKRIVLHRHVFAVGAEPSPWSSPVVDRPHRGQRSRLR